MFLDARNVLNSTNIQALSLNAFPNQFVNLAGDDYTTTTRRRRAGAPI